MAKDVLDPETIRKNREAAWVMYCRSHAECPKNGGYWSAEVGHKRGKGILRWQDWSPEGRARDRERLIERQAALAACRGLA